MSTSGRVKFKKKTSTISTFVCIPLAIGHEPIEMPMLSESEKKKSPIVWRQKLCRYNTRTFKTN